MNLIEKIGAEVQAYAQSEPLSEPPEVTLIFRNQEDFHRFERRLGLWVQNSPLNLRRGFAGVPQSVTWMGVKIRFEFKNK